MSTPAESAYNLQTLARRVATSLGIKDARSMDLDQRQAYNAALVSEILKYPNGFTQDILNRAATTNTDYGLRGHEFDSALDIAGDAIAPVLGGLQNVGQGAIATLNTAKWLIPLTVIALVIIWLLNRRRPPAAHA